MDFREGPAPPSTSAQLPDRVRKRRGGVHGGGVQGGGLWFVWSLGCTTEVFRASLPLKRWSWVAQGGNQSEINGYVEYVDFCLEMCKF